MKPPGVTGEAFERRRLLRVAALAAGGLALSTHRTMADKLPHSPFAVVAPDNSGDFGPLTPGTRTGGIQEAIDAVHRQGGGVVLLRAGEHRVDYSAPPPPEARQFNCGERSLLLYDGITLCGEGAGVTIIRTASPCNTNGLLGWQTSNVRVENLTLDGAGLNAGYGLAIFGLDRGKGTAFHHVLIRGVVCTGFGGSAFGIAGGREVILEQCEGRNSKIGFELGSPSVDYAVLHCLAAGCTNGTLIFDPADQFNEAGNLRPGIVGGSYDGEGKASGVALWDCWEPVVLGVAARRGVTCNIQIAPSGRKSITTPVGGGLIEGCVAEASVGSTAGRYGIGAFQDGVRVIGCSLLDNEDAGVQVGPGDGGQVMVGGCLFRSGPREVQRYAIAAQGKGVTLRAQANLHEGPPERFLGNPGALSSASLVTENAGFNPVGILEAPPIPPSGTVQPNPYPFPVRIYVLGGRVRGLAFEDAHGRRIPVASGSGASLLLQPGEAIVMDYHRQPRWSWIGL